MARGRPGKQRSDVSVLAKQCLDQFLDMNDKLRVGQRNPAPGCVRPRLRIFPVAVCECGKQEG